MHHPGTEGALQVPWLRRVENLGKAPADFVQHLVRRIQRGIGHDNGELFTTVTANEIGLAQALLEKQRQALDHPVAHGVAVAVVDLLEVVDVEHGKAQRLLLTAGAEAAVFQQLQDVGVVVQPGQAVAHHARLQVPGAGGAVAHGGDQVA
ncbi:hypothetical protein D3C76_1266920 [compost metagenome]